MAKKKVYAVRKGKKTGLFYSWIECEAAVSGYANRFLACLLQCAGVADYSTFTVNGVKTALRINSGTIPVLGTVDVTTY